MEDDNKNVEIQDAVEETTEKDVKKENVFSKWLSAAGAWFTKLGQKIVNLFNKLSAKIGKRNMIISCAAVAVVLIAVIVTVSVVCANNSSSSKNATAVTVSYELEGGTSGTGALDTYTTKNGDVVIPNPTKTGYTFLGWTTSENSTPKTDYVIAAGTTGDLTLTANWEANDYTININANGYTLVGNTGSTCRVFYDSDYTFPKVSVTGNAYFKGWMYNGELVTDANGFTDKWSIAEDVTLTPKIVKIYDYTDTTQKSLTFGSYPQTKVTDTTLLSTLNDKAGTLPTAENLQNWKDYGYYNFWKVESYMYYIDIDLDKDGENDYRGVYFTHKRCWATNEDVVVNPQLTYHSYDANQVYWFKYEPIKWTILETKNNKMMIISDLILDSQDFNHINYTLNDDEGENETCTDYQGNSKTDMVYAANYKYSAVRSWLNTAFYETAFKSYQNAIINTTTIDNSASSTSGKGSRYVCEDTQDKMFSLSYTEASTYYTDDTSRVVGFTDYAKSQGLFAWPNSPTIGQYWLRSPCDDNKAWHVSETGEISDSFGDTVNTYYGIRAVCWITSFES